MVTYHVDSNLTLWHVGVSCHVSCLVLVVVVCVCAPCQLASRPVGVGVSECRGCRRCRVSECRFCLDTLDTA